MADDDSEDEEPAIVLGDGVEVEGAPLARVSARLMWGIEKSEIEGREGDTTIRTPDGPRELGEVLADVDQTYFGTRQEFEQAVRAVIGSGPVPTPEADETPADEGTDEDDSAAEDEGAEVDDEADAEADDEADEEADESEPDEADTDEDETDGEADADEGSEEADADSEDADGESEEAGDEA
jgi:hypothetical protein